MSNFEVLPDLLTESDHAPIMCTISLSKAFRIDFKFPEPRFIFREADWKKYGHFLDEIINEIDFEEEILTLDHGAKQNVFFSSSKICWSNYSKTT